MSAAPFAHPAPISVLIAVPTSDREASRAFVAAVFGPPLVRRPALPPLSVQMADLAVEMERHRALAIAARAERLAVANG